MAFQIGDIVRITYDGNHAFLRAEGVIEKYHGEDAYWIDFGRPMGVWPAKTRWKTKHFELVRGPLDNIPEEW